MTTNYLRHSNVSNKSFMMVAPHSSTIAMKHILLDKNEENIAEIIHLSRMAILRARLVLWLRRQLV